MVNTMVHTKTMTAALAACAALAGCGGGGAGPGANGPGSSAGDDPASAAPAGVWLSMAPKQAGNFWEGVQPGDATTGGYPLPELENVDGYFETKGIELRALGLVWPTEPVATCESLSCPRGDTLVVVADAADADRLVAELRFTRLPARAFFTRPALQCESAWGAGGAPAEEATRLVEWAAQAGGAPAQVGFLFATGATSRAQVCGAPRGDWALVATRDAAGAGVLSGAGFAASP